MAREGSDPRIEAERKSAGGELPSVAGRAGSGIELSLGVGRSSNVGTLRTAVVLARSTAAATASSPEPGTVSCGVLSSAVTGRR